MVSSAGSSPAVSDGEELVAGIGGAAGLGTVFAAGGDAIARATGVSDGAGVCVAFGFSDSSSRFGDAVAFADFFFLPGLGDPFFPVDFFFGVGVESSSSAAFFFFFGVGDLCAAGDGVFFALGFGCGVGDSSAFASDCSSAAAIRIWCSPLPTCPRRPVARSATSTIAVIPPLQTRTTAADRIRPDDGFKQPAPSPANFPARYVSRARVSESHSTFRPGAEANRSGTSRSAKR